MSLADNYKILSYTSDGEQMEFPILWRFFDKDTVLAKVYRDGILEKELSYGQDYSVTPTGETGGKLVLTAPVAKGLVLAISRKEPYIQALELLNSGKIDLVKLEEALDHTVMLAQQNRDDLDRSLQVPPGSNLTEEEFVQELLKSKYEARCWAEYAEKQADRTVKIPSETEVLASGTVSPRSIADRFADVVNVKDFGAKGDGVTDDTEAIQAAIDYAKKFGKLCFSDAMHLVSGTLFIDCNCDFSRATVNAHGAEFYPILSVGQKETNHSTLTPGKHIRLPRVVNLDKPATGFDGIEGSIGVQMLNLFYAEVHVTDIVGFYRGLYITSNQTGNAWNTYYIGRLTNNKINLDIYPIGTGWVNQNTFIGGRFQANDPTNNVIQISIGKETKEPGKWGPNNNIFIGCDLSDSGVEYAIDCSACHNYFYGCRFEYDVRVRFKTHFDGDIVAFNGIYGGLRTESLSIEVDNTLGGTIRNNEVDAPSKKLFDFFDKNDFLALGRQMRQGVYARFYPPSVNVCQAKETDSNWLFEISSNGICTKKYYTSPNPNIQINNEIKLSSGANTTDGVVIKQSLDKQVLFGGNIFTAIAPEISSGGSLGSHERLWSQVYAKTGTINTSDSREKISITDPNEALMRACSKVNFKSFQFIDAVEKKGEDARIHFGILAQQVAEAFASEGLDASRYALFCYDKWDDEYEDVEVVDMEAVLDDDGNEVKPAQTHMEKKLVTKAGERYGIRYNEALCMEAAYQRRRADRLEARIAALEAKLK